MMQNPIRIVQISDLHIFGDSKKSLLGVNTRESFSAVFEVLKADPKQPELVILSGDLSQDGSEASYRFLGDKMQVLSIPTYYIPGNHDNSQVMDLIYPYGVIQQDKHIILGDWQIILLDSHIHETVHGELNQQQLDFMSHCLEQYPMHHAIIVFHHQPIKVGCAWLDNLGLKNADEFWEQLKKYPQVNTVLFGHVHQQHEGMKHNIHYYSVPSTCIQFKKNVPQFALDKIPPCYRWIDLYPNGELKTEITQVKQYVGYFDEKATGY